MDKNIQTVNLILRI